MPLVRRPSSVDAQLLTHAHGPGWWTRLACRLWGHHVDNHVLRRARGPRRVCRCGEPYLETDGSYTRVRHTLSCFFGHHTYVRIAARDGHHEYACVQCGHPLVFAEYADPYADAAVFRKKVRYLCGVFGHHVHPVTSRDGFTEYACHCGHSFLKDDQPGDIIRHPAICIRSGHWVRYVTARGGYSEYVCRHCGHPFCFADPEPARR